MLRKYVKKLETLNNKNQFPFAIPPRAKKNKVKTYKVNVAPYLLCVLLSGLFGCATLPPLHFEDFDRGQWEGKLLVEDSKQNRSYILNLDIISFRPERLRVDVTSTIGSHLATVTMRDNKVSYILLREKKYFEGKPNSQVLKPVLSMELDPRVIIDLLFDLPPREKGWECQRDENDYLTRCHNTGRKITVVWKKRLGRQRVLVISSKLAKLQLNLRKFRSKVEENDEIFVLKSPRGFSKVKSR